MYTHMYIQIRIYSFTKQCSNSIMKYLMNLDNRILHIIYTDSIKELKILFSYMSPQFIKMLLVPWRWSISITLSLSYKEDLESQCKEDRAALFAAALSL